MPRPKKLPPLSAEIRQAFDYVASHPNEQFPKAIIDKVMSYRSEMIAQAERGNKTAKLALDLLMQFYVGSSDPLVAYMARMALRRRGPRPKISDTELSNASARLRRKKPKATATDLSRMLTREGLGSFSPDYLRRRLKRIAE